MKNKISLIGIVFLAMLVTISSVAALEITSIGDQTVSAGNEFVYDLTTDSANNVTYTVQSGPGTIDGNQYKWTPDAGDEGDNPVVIYAEEDANASENDTESFTITVLVDDGQFSADNLELGSDKQERGKTITKTWTITNTGDKQITNIDVTTLGVGSEYSLNVTQDKTTLNAGETLTVTLISYVPWDKDSERQLIGTLKVTGTGATEIQKSIYMEAKSQIDVTAIFEEDSGNREKADKDKTITLDPFSSVTLTVEVENTYSDRDDDTENIDMDVDAYIDSNDIDELDNEDDSFDNLDPGDKDTVDFTFSLDPADVDFNDEPFSVDIRVEAEDANGAIHVQEFTVDIELDRATRDVRLSDVSFSKTSVECEDDEIKLDVSLVNVGKRDLDEAMIRVEMDDVEGRTLIRDLNIDEGDTKDFRLTYNIPKGADLEPGTSYMTVSAYPENDLDKWTDSKVYEITVKSCDKTTTTDNNIDNSDSGTTTIPTITTQTPGEDTVTVTGTPVSSASGSSLFGVSGASSTYMIILGVIVLILIILVVVLLITLLRK